MLLFPKGMSEEVFIKISLPNGFLLLLIFLGGALSRIQGSFTVIHPLMHSKTSYVFILEELEGFVHKSNFTGLIIIMIDPQLCSYLHTIRFIMWSLAELPLSRMLADMTTVRDLSEPLIHLQEFS